MAAVFLAQEIPLSLAAIAKGVSSCDWLTREATLAARTEPGAVFFPPTEKPAPGFY